RGRSGRLRALIGRHRSRIARLGWRLRIRALVIQRGLAWRRRAWRIGRKAWLGWLRSWLILLIPTRDRRIARHLRKHRTAATEHWPLSRSRLTRPSPSMRHRFYLARLSFERVVAPSLCAWSLPHTRCAGEI